jgi:hypothetical protein
VTKSAGLEGSIYAGLESLTGLYLSRAFRREDGAELNIERCLIDANWGASMVTAKSSPASETWKRWKPTVGFRKLSVMQNCVFVFSWRVSATYGSALGR